MASNVSGYWRTRRVHQYESPEGQEISPLPSRFSTTSRLSRQLDSALSPSASRTFSRVSHLDGLERSSSQGNGYAPYRRQDDGSIAGLHRDSTNERDVPLNRYSQMDGRQRAESVLATHADRYRYSLSGNSTSAHMSQMPEKRRFETSLRDREVRSGSTLNLTPGDSVSALGARDDHLETGKKDPLLLLKRIEAQRARYNQQWKVDRAASVIDYHEIPRSGSRFDHTPQRVRPMSSLQNYGPVPRTAPIERQRRPLVEADSPSLERSSSRSSHAIYPLTEPRPMRSSTSAGGVYAVDMNSYKSSSDHGQLLYEAFHSLETKLPQEKLDAVAAFRSATTTTESVNSTLRTALQLAMQISIDVEVNPENVRDEFNRLILLLRDANKSSDQNVRDLTQVMLDLPKMPRETMNGRSSNEVPRRWRPVSPMTDDSPIRQRGGLLRPATSMGNYYSTSKRMSRDASSTNMTMGQDPSIRISTPPTEAEDPITTLRQDDLPDGGASPPSGSPGASVHADYNVPPPRNVEQPRNVLKKKASVMSTNTVRGSTFLPSASRVRTTTAISVVTIGDISPTRARSVISQKKSGDWDELGQFEPSTPMSKFSFQTAHESQAGSEIESDAVSLLARAAKNRNERVGAESSENQAPGGAVSRRASMSERFRATLRRNTGKQG